MAVADTAKVRIWKQITTIWLKALHPMAVADTAKVRIWKQITTNELR